MTCKWTCLSATKLRSTQLQQVQWISQVTDWIAPSAPSCPWWQQWSQSTKGFLGQRTYPKMRSPPLRPWLKQRQLTESKHASDTDWLTDWPVFDPKQRDCQKCKKPSSIMNAPRAWSCIMTPIELSSHMPCLGSITTSTCFNRLCHWLTWQTFQASSNQTWDQTHSSQRTPIQSLTLGSSKS